MSKHHKIFVAVFAVVTGIATTALIALHFHNHPTSTPVRTADSDGPGNGGGYADDDGPGLGGGYADATPGPGGSGYADPNPGPGSGGGYADPTPGPGGSAGYLLADDGQNVIEIF